MKVVAFNGSPKKNGNTYGALELVAAELEKEGTEVEIIHVGNQAVRGCTACGGCARNRNERCIIDTDPVNEWIQKIKEADGILLGAPVHYADINATMKSFLDRAFYVASNNGGLFRHKVGAGVVAVRRAGGLPAFHQLNTYLTYAQMFIPTSNYWNVVFGLTPGQVAEDVEGNQIMRILGKNMAWLLKAVAAGKEQFPLPENEKKQYMHFIR